MIVSSTTGSTCLRQAEVQQPNRVQTLSRVINRSASRANVGPSDWQSRTKDLDLPSPDPAALIDFLDGQERGIDHGSLAEDHRSRQGVETPTSRD